MHTIHLESADLFTPGRASYITSAESDFESFNGFQLNLTEGAEHRAAIAAATFDEDFHTQAIFAGGYPGIAEHWPVEHTPPLGLREADYLAVPLEEKLRARGWSEDRIQQRVKRQGISNNSIGDVLISAEQGLLDPNFYGDNKKHGVQLVAGALHGYRFRRILSKALDISPARIQRVPMHDVYGRPASEFRPEESAAAAYKNELGAIAVTELVLRDIRPGNLEDLRKAEDRFNTIAARHSA